MDLLGVLAGFLVWTLAEYLLHRFVFHGEDNWLAYVPENRFIFTGHFWIHGLLHSFPSDRLRLVFPPIPGYMIMELGFNPLFKSLLPALLLPSFTAGF